MRKHKIISLFLSIALLITLVPAGIGSVKAASLATYFIPDINEIRQTAELQTDSSGAANFLSRDNAYKTNNGLLTVKGTFSYVGKDTMTVKIEQLLLQSNGKWAVDPTRSAPGSIQADNDSTNRYTANNLQLFSGYNRITFSGMQGNVGRSDVFYVLYDKVPYLQTLKMSGGVTGTVTLNEGSQVAVESDVVTLQGTVKNATKVTVSVNDGQALLSSLLEDGTFFTPTLNLNPGLNTIKLTVQNGSDSVIVTRSVYYFDKLKPFTKLELVEGANTYNLLDKTPTVTLPAAAPLSAKLKVQMLVKYENDAFGNAGNATYSVTSVTGSVYAPPTAITGATDIQFPGSDGVTPAYRLVTFTTSNLSFNSGNHNFGLNVSYTPAGVSPAYTFTAAKNMSFKYLPGETQITEMYYLPSFKDVAGDINNNVSNITKTPLNGADLQSSDFYVLVKSDNPGSMLEGVYMPLATLPGLAIANTTNAAAGLGTNEKVFKISGFSAGQQKVRFNYTGSNATYTANLSYVSKTYVYVSNLNDGQSYTFDSRLTTLPTLFIKGEYIGFDSLSNVNYFVNGVDVEHTTSLSSPDKVLGIDSTTPPNAREFQLTLHIGPNSPIVYGENRIVFIGTSTDGSGNSKEIRKELRIYVIDENVSTIKNFQPALIPKNAAGVEDRMSIQLPITSTLTDALFTQTGNDFQFIDGKYVTSQKKYDLILYGNGASKLNLSMGSTVLFSGLDIFPAADIDSIHSTLPPTPTGTGYHYVLAGSQDAFVLRIEGIPFDTPGSHVYNLELINGTGARTTQRLEISRVVAPYRILSPLPTVGNDIIVNKNFVRFDIEAEGATQILIDGKPAVPRKDPQFSYRFVYDYVGLKPDKSTAIKVQIKRPDGTFNQTVNVYYASSVQEDSQFMVKLASKISVFDKKLNLTFPKNTLLKSAVVGSLSVPKFYKDTQLLFGIADPVNGILEKRNDYGNIIGTPDQRTTNGTGSISIPDEYLIRFSSNTHKGNFSRVSPVYWISGGLGELGDKGNVGYKEATNGVTPYSVEGTLGDPLTQPQTRKVVPSNRGSLNLSFDANVVEDVGYTVTVFRFTDRGEWQNIGGAVDPKKNTITVPFDDFGYYMVGKLRDGFNDITNHPWARNVLNGLYSKGIMDPVRPPTEFGADDQTTRGEFATLLVKGLQLPIRSDGNQTFFDVVPGTSSATWDYEHIETAARAGIVAGLSERFFGPDIKISREDASVMIGKALELKLALNDSKLQAALGKMFVDSAAVQPYARPSVQAVAKAGIMSGSPITLPGQTKPVFNFNPKANMTRAEAAQVTVKLLQKKTNLFPKTLN